MSTLKFALSTVAWPARGGPGDQLPSIYYAKMNAIEIIGVEMTDKIDASKTHLIDEYKVCQQKATALERNIYTSATIWGGGSVVVLATLLTFLIQEPVKQSNIPNYSMLITTYILGLLAITALLSWRRLSKRWLGIANTMFIRMAHIEREINLRANLYVRYYDDKFYEKDRGKEVVKHRFQFSKDAGNISFKEPFLDGKLIQDLDDIAPKHYEYRSQWVMLDFFFVINIIAWILVILIQVFLFISDNFPMRLLSNCALLSKCALLNVLSILTIVFIVYLRHSWKQK